MSGALEKWTAAGVVISGLALLAAMAAGGIAYFQFRSGLEQDRIKQTIEFLKLSYADPIGPAQQRIWTALGANRDDLQKQIITNKNTMTSTQRADAFRKVVESLITREKLGNDITQVYSFYNEIAICVKADVCDYASAKTFFENDFDDFTSWFEPYVIDNLRQNSRAYTDSEFYKLLKRIRGSG
jgi:hypothetical protein